MQAITENSAKIRIKTAEIVSKKMPVFYNPVMKFNRDVSVILLNSLGRKNMNIALPLAGTGISGIRFLNELKKGVACEICFNDYGSLAVRNIKDNLKLNKINLNKINTSSTKTIWQILITKKEANLFLLNSNGFDYIDIDPFGSPNPFLDSAVKRLAREGILAVTATDTSALSGTYPRATKRKYFAAPMRNYLMHEIGIRILIRKVQLIGAQYEKALTPIFCYSKDHYYRVFFVCEKGKMKVDEEMRKHKYFLYCNKCMNFFADKYNRCYCENCDNKQNNGQNNGQNNEQNNEQNSKQLMEYAGPLWTGALFDKDIVKKMKKEGYKKVIGDKDSIRFFETLLEEAELDIIGFYDLHELVSRYKLGEVPKLAEVIKKIQGKGEKAVRAHILGFGIRTNKKIKELVELIKKMKKYD